MIPCFAVEIKTPKGYSLRGLWFGTKKPRRAIVWVHGLGSSLFSKLRIVEQAAKGGTAVLVFNNRGHDIVAMISRTDGRRKRVGAAHEIFSECVDDIQGALKYVRKAGAKSVYLAGHSTGCQKSIYWTHMTKGTGVKGIILLAPVSDYADAVAKFGKERLERTAMKARALVRAGKKNAYVSVPVDDQQLNDAQRFLSLYTPDSAEELFPYAQPKKNPRILRSIKKPILVFWAEKDEYADRPAREIAAWFERNLKSKHRVAVIPAATHSFRGAERRVAREIKKFIGA